MVVVGAATVLAVYFDQVQGRMRVRAIAQVSREDTDE